MRTYIARRIGQGQRRHGNLVLAGEAQRGAAGGQHRQARAGGEEVGEEGRRGEHLLAVVDHEQQVAVAQGVPQPLKLAEGEDDGRVGGPDGMEQVTGYDDGIWPRGDHAVDGRLERRGDVADAEQLSSEVERLPRELGGVVERGGGESPNVCRVEMREFERGVDSGPEELV